MGSSAAIASVLSGVGEGFTTAGPGTLAPAGTVAVSSAGTLSGTGTIQGAVTDRGILAPGANGIGTLAAGPETWNGGGGFTSPMVAWPVVTNGTFGPGGVAAFTDTAAATNTARYYRISSP